MVINVSVTAIYLGYFFGTSFIIAAALAATVLIVNTNFSSKLKAIIDQKEKLSDIKNNMLSEIVNNIKIIKLYNWQHIFGDRLSEARIEEMNKYREQLRCSAL